MNRSLIPADCSRRGFLSKCATCAGCAASSSLLTSGALAASTGKPKIRLVFCETANNKPIWPNIGYDFDARRNQMIATLTQGCPELALLPMQVVEGSKELTLAKVLEADAEVAGYIICLQGLGWSNDVVKLSSSGKPTLVVDNLFGGSGLFLTRLPALMKLGKPIDWVSSANDQDIVASAKAFSLLGQGKSAADVVAAFRATRHQKTPTDADQTCTADKLPAVNFEEAFKKLRQTKLLVVGGGWGGDPFRKASKEVTGVEFIPIAFPEMTAAYAAATDEAGRAFADRWMSAAKEVVEPKRDEIERSGKMYAAMDALIKKHNAMGIAVNCLGGFYGGHIAAYPCLGFSQLNNDGLVGACEADQISALTMAMMGIMIGRPGYISDPAIDTSRNCIIYAHCVAMTKPFGPNGPSNPFRIRSHSEDRKGASIESLLPAGYLTTTIEIDPMKKQVLMHQAKTIGCNPSDMACRTKLEGLVLGNLEKLTENWRPGWHRVTFYGDLKPIVVELCDRLKLALIEEA